MFGTIGHFRPKPGHEEQIVAHVDEWNRTIRPSVPGLVGQFTGQPTDRPNELLTIILMRDEVTYRELAQRPEQDAWYRALVEHLEAEPTWDDVAWKSAQLDVVAAPR